MVKTPATNLLCTPSTSMYWLSRNFTRAWAMVNLVVVMFAPCMNANLSINSEPMWERACSRMRCVSHPIHLLIHRIREQARSHSLARVRFEGFAGGRCLPRLPAEYPPTHARFPQKAQTTGNRHTQC